MLLERGNPFPRAPLAALQQLLESAIRIALDDTVAGNREGLADQDEIAKAFGEDAVKKLMADRGGSCLRQLSG